jgi:hypothetical protein
MATKDPDGHVWIYGGFLVNNYCNQLWRFKMSTLEWTFFGGNFTTGSLESAPLYGRYDQIGTFSAYNYPPATLYGALVYAGNGMLAMLTNTFVRREIYMSQNLWYYNITSNEWAMMYAVTSDEEVMPSRGNFQQMDPTANIGARISWGRSRTLGNIWIARGIDSNSLVANTDTLVFPVSLCLTDLAPSCSTDAKCEDHIGWAECVCISGVEDDGKTCISVLAPQSGIVPASKTPIKPTNNSVAVVYDLALIYVALLSLM